MLLPCTKKNMTLTAHPLLPNFYLKQSVRSTLANTAKNYINNFFTQYIYILFAVIIANYKLLYAQNYPCLFSHRSHFLFLLLQRPC